MAVMVDGLSIIQEEKFLWLVVVGQVIPTMVLVVPVVEVVV
jgi:hypothetical protein